MSKLEEEIVEAIENESYGDGSPEGLAKVVALIAKRYIEKAFKDGVIIASVVDMTPEKTEQATAKYLKEQGL
jgi:hypothetical protein